MLTVAGNRLHLNLSTMFILVLLLNSLHLIELVPVVVRLEFHKFASLQNIVSVWKIKKARIPRRKKT